MSSYKTNILICVLSVMLILGLTNCTSSTDIVDNRFSPLIVSIKDTGFIDTINAKTTRTLDNRYTTTFTNGDKIGLFVVDGSGNVTTRNLCLTYDGTNWNYPTGTMIYYDNSSTTKYFAYYPYQSTEPTTSTKTTSASDFFSTTITNWETNLPTDQSTYAKYTAADLMIGAGSVGTLSSNATRPLIFSMNHQMGLVEINMPYYYLSTDANYKYIPGLAWTNFTPYNISGTTYHYIVKPSTPITIAGEYAPLIAGGSFENFSQNINVAAGKYQTINIDGGAIGTSHTLTIGDYYLSDGSVIPNVTTNKYLLDKAIGVIFTTSTSTIDKGHGWTHGYAMALKNAAKNIMWGPNTVDTPIPNIYSEADIKNSMDGYTETHLINSTYTLSPTNYPVFYYALNYNVATPKGSSGWYLPSIGQWYNIIVNLGKVSTTSTSINVAELGWSNGEISSCPSNINKYLAALDNGYRVDKFYTSPGTPEYYSATSEYTSNYSYRLYFQSAVNILWLDGNNEDDDKTLTCYISRPAIAF